MRPVRRAALALALAAAVLASCATAQTWRDYEYPRAGFSVQFPAPPRVSTATYRTAGGMTVPATVYSMRQDGVIYSVTVADFAATAMDEQTAIADAVRALSATGEVRMDVVAHVNVHFGRLVSVAGRDGSRTSVEIFFFNHRLYELKGQILPPDPEARSNRIVRFVDTLSFDPTDTKGPAAP